MPFDASPPVPVEMRVGPSFFFLSNLLFLLDTYVEHASQAGRLEHRFRGENNRLDEAIDVKKRMCPDAKWTVGQGMMTSSLNRTL